MLSIKKQFNKTYLHNKNRDKQLNYSKYLKKGPQCHVLYFVQKILLRDGVWGLVTTTSTIDKITASKILNIQIEFTAPWSGYKQKT